MFDETIVSMLIEGTWATLYMTLVSTLFGYIIGLPLGIILAITDKEGKAHRRKKLRRSSNHRSSYHCGSTIYWTYGRVILKGSR